MSLFRKNQPPDNTVMLQTARSRQEYTSSAACENGLYESLRKSVPVIDAALSKIVRLTGGYRVLCLDEKYQEMLDDFVAQVPVGLTGKSLQVFTDGYLDSLLTYGNAAGEIIADISSGNVLGLYNADVSCIEVEQGATPFKRRYFVRGDSGEKTEVENPALVMFTALKPMPGQIYGASMLRGLPAVSAVLMKIYECIGQNFDRLGNIRYAVTYRPPEGAGSSGRERAKQIAEEWSKGMTGAAGGEIRDFVAVGDVDIRVIGADSQTLDTNIPVRQLLEQIVAKLSLPPFMLGLSWSSTERMSSQQADILTSELEYYRRLLVPVITQAALAFLRLRGCPAQVRVEWDKINLQDEVALAESRLKNAQAAQIEKKLGIGEYAEKY